MRDALGREINYLRLSVTDRCNLRCRYCMPNGAPALCHNDILSYEEILFICQAAITLGFDRFKITGGEPLVRKGCVDLIRRLKALPGVKQVTLTTNGLALGEALNELAAIPLDGVNLSLDTLDPLTYQSLTGADAAALPTVTAALERCVQLGIPTKINAVLARAAFSGLPALLALAQRLPVDVRLIELMPIGEGGAIPGVSSSEALTACRALYPDLHPLSGRRGNGPARYFGSQALRGAIGLIDSLSHPFCAQCNRARLTSVGLLKPCLCYGDGLPLRPLLQSGASLDRLAEAMAACLEQKPASHCFLKPEAMTEHSAMNRIGG